MGAFELLPQEASPNVSLATTLEWPSQPGRTDTVAATLDPCLTQLGPAPIPAIDLVRVATGAYLADRLSPRGQGFSRTIEFHVHLIDPSRWGEAAEVAAALLHWLTGDHWRLVLHEDRRARLDPAAVEGAESVTLLSGGLDSFSGAIITAAAGAHPLHLGHWDNPTVKGAQNAVRAWLDDALPKPPCYLSVSVTSVARREGSSRSRSFLFMALAVATAAAGGASRVDVPENGFTSLNPPLSPDRGGALSTRSTHPTTFDRMNRLLQLLVLDISVEDPFALLTKGQLVQKAAETRIGDFAAGAARTLSCGKLDGRLYRGGNPNHHCGLCVPCLVRRGAFLAAGVPDASPYLSEYLAGEALEQLRRRRADDIAAVKLAVRTGFDDALLLASGPFPTTFDLDAAFELCETGLKELALVPLP